MGIESGEALRRISENIFSRPAEQLVKKGVSADAVTASSLALGALGVWSLSDPSTISERIHDISRGRLTPSKETIRAIGSLALGASFVLDLVDGAVARRSTAGPTKHGKIFDITIDKAIETFPAIFNVPQSKRLHEKLTWLTYLFSNPLPSLIRSVAARHGIEIGEIDWNARIARLPILISSLIFENKRQFLGKILVLQTLSATLSRYQRIRREGNHDALQNINSDLIDYSGLFLISRISNIGNIPRDLLTLGLELAKLAQVKARESTRQTFKTLEGNKPNFFLRSAFGSYLFLFTNLPFRSVIPAPAKSGSAFGGKAGIWSPAQGWILDQAKGSEFTESVENDRNTWPSVCPLPNPIFSRSLHS